MTNIKQLVQRVQRYYRFRFVLIPMAFFAFVFKLSYVTQVEDQSLQPLQLSTTRKSGERKVPINYAVFATSTPNGESYRSYDYAYNVPLTALAWERIGFRSIVLIIGSRCEWENEPLSNSSWHAWRRDEALPFSSILLCIIDRLWVKQPEYWSPTWKDFQAKVKIIW